MQKIILLTGATSGIGRAAAETIAKAGHKLIFTARNPAKAEATKNEIVAACGNEEVNYLLADFSSLQSVSELAETFMTQHPHLDVLINNAGVWEVERKYSKDGIEMNFAVNHLAPFLLTLSLLDALKKAGAGRIVTTSSMAHRRNILNLEDPEFRHETYNGVATYSQSKMCNLLFTLQLQKELNGTGITANTVHPGYVKTELFNNMGTHDWSQVPPASDGARSTVYAALSPELDGVSGKYIYHEGFESPTSMAQDKALAQKVWDISMQYVQPFLALQKTA